MLNNIAIDQPIAFALLVLAITSVAGLAIGSISIRRVRFGTAGVLFAGVAFGHLGLRPDSTILTFVKEFGLILFVFTIGLQLGSGFFSALKREGLRLNLLAAGVVALGSLLAVIAWYVFRLDGAAAVGLLSGATTNTPSLGAAQQVLEGLGSADALAMPALAYAVAYPGAIVGIILSLLLLRTMYRVDVEQEAQRFRSKERSGVESLQRTSLVVQNDNLDGLPVGMIPGRVETGVIISRIRHAEQSETLPATEDTILQRGDTILAVGTEAGLEQIRRVVGRTADGDLLEAPGRVHSRRIVVTHPKIPGRTIRELGLDHLYGVTVTRVMRADLEMTALPHFRIQFGDMLQVVGDEEGLGDAEQALGNSLGKLNETRFIPIFIGIALGILVGIQAVSVPGLPIPVRLGLAGGPLVVALILGRLGHVGRLVWYMPTNANIAFRELGITLFLACVGLQAGERFVETVLTSTGLTWVALGAVITVVPLIVIGVIARSALRMNYLTISGVITGSMTDPPALAFASGLSWSNAPMIAYAAVYPLTMLLRILLAQVLVLALAG